MYRNLFSTTIDLYHLMIYREQILHCRDPQLILLGLIFIILIVHKILGKVTGLNCIKLRHAKNLILSLLYTSHAQNVSVCPPDAPLKTEEVFFKANVCPFSFYFSSFFSFIIIIVSIIIIIIIIFFFFFFFSYFFLIFFFFFFFFFFLSIFIDY